MELKKATHTAMKIVGVSIIRTAIYSILFMVALIILKLYNTDNYPMYFGFIVGSLIANVIHVMIPYLQKPVKEPRMQ